MNAATITFVDARGGRWSSSADALLDASLPILPDGATPRAFGLPAATEAPVPIGGGRVLRVRAGASVNCDGLHLHPHGDGSHLECAAHILAEDDPRAAAAKATLAAASPLWCGLLVDVRAVPLGESGETYAGTHAPDDAVISAAALAPALTAARARGPGLRYDALILRVQAAPVEDDVDFSGRNPPYPTDQAATLLAAEDARLLVLDLPSLDREDDGGTTPNHRAWWGLGPGRSARLDRLVFELARLPAGLDPGPVAVHLGAAPLRSDAVPASLRVAALGPESRG